MTPPAMHPAVGAGALARSAGAHLSRELGAVLLPPLLHDVGQEARRLEGIDASRSGSSRALAQALERLEGRSGDMHRLGWTLGVLSAGMGADLLRSRRERQGLSLFLASLVRALGRDVAPRLRSLPHLGPERGAGWELPLLLAGFLLGAHRQRPGSDPLRWHCVSDASGWVLWSLDCFPTDPTIRAAALLVPGAKISCGPCGWGGIALPPGWLVRG